MEWQFDLDGVQIEGPIGFSAIAFNVMRDERWHGVFFEASTTQLSFYGNAYDILFEAKRTQGFDAVVVFTASSRCEGEDDFQEAISGKLNFSNWSDSCGDECLVRLSVEQDNCAMVFKNRFDQKVNIDSNVSFDKQTILQDYTGLGFELELATQEIPIAADAEITEPDIVELDIIDFTAAEFTTLYIRPVYNQVNDNSILTGNLDTGQFYQDPQETFLITPQVLLESDVNCIAGEYSYNVRMKGSATATAPGSSDFKLWVVLDYWDGNGVHHVDGVHINAAVIQDPISSGVTYNFDEIYSGTIVLPEGVGVYAYVQYTYEGGTAFTSLTDINVTFDEETSFVLSNVKACPATPAEVYMINETLARVTESITDRCLTVKSDYYGRTDSQPYTSAADGCGSLRVLTPGLKIRQAPDKDFFASPKEIIEGLRAIDNIGMGMESDRIRIEPAEWFYQDVKIMDLPLIPKARSNAEERLVYSNLLTGYTKWEIKSIKGIDEYNSAKEFRTGIKSISNTLDIRSNLIAAGYIIEDLRTKTLLGTGNTDNTYDNDVFIICVERGGYDYIVEQNVAENTANFFSPATAYNWRIRPMYNLMRWFKSIAQSYVSLASTTSKLFFTSGTGNYLAEGMLAVYDVCRLENKVMAENDDLAYSDFENTIDATPIYKPETIIFDYPLSLSDYKLIKATPYGYFNVQCGNGDFFKAYIKQLSYKPAEGIANFNLIKAWQ